MTVKRLSTLTVLVADDFEDTRALLRRMLESHNCRVVEAADGLEAVEMARRACPNLILMDLNMPMLDGLAAAEQIRSCQEGCRGVPILAITAFDTYGMREAALEAGCDAYLLKPLALDELEAVVARLLAG